MPTLRHLRAATLESVRLQGTGMGVFTPVQPSLAGWLGDVPVFQELLRWFGGDDPLDVAEVRWAHAR